MRTLLIILIALTLMSCKTYTTNYKIVSKERCYYTDKVTYIKDSIMFYEKYRNGRPKVPFVLPYSGTEIITSK